ncbi:polysaccharide deacetylase [Gracilibacillus halophilus YIM-C55.5]|uniref:Polysaccharide deacetylase n=1 Tax=Gracilibacillus halophilus YIM-C55.5 TaxID=1308866 RepID=N4W7H3_9BACI|nr:polysaccharide deacetylase family protein [Gracilibacillus halophilus]ENH96218.1 polysaccharide deacetylase [Gracilibacillus halophilus YIM-C55.5]
MSRKHVFNIGFTLVFLVCFACIIMFFKDDILHALFRDGLFPIDETIEMEACQNWTDDVRDFELTDREKAESVSVLMYHRVVEEKHLNQYLTEDDGSIVSTVILKSNFIKQMDLLRDEGYTTLTLKELELFIKGEIDVPKKSIVLTFDDGFKDNAKEVYPILKERGLKGVSFVITGAISKFDAKYQPGEYQYFSASDIISSCDVFDFQSHTYNYHQRMEDDTPFLIGKEDEQVTQDLERSLVNLNGRNQAFASPYGGYDEGNIETFQELGFDMAFTVIPNDVTRETSVYEIPRKEVFPDDSLEDFKEKIGLNVP